MRKLVSCAIGVLACALQAEQPPVEWIRSHAVRIETPEAGHGFADLQPFKKMIGDARIVSLGEATHGSREFFQLKHRMLEFLATDMGFTIFSIEANMPEAYRLNDFVLNGTGDPAKLLKGMYFWTWDTQEVLDMILWMREFNKSGKGRVEFTGFDMQTPDVAMANVRDYVARKAPDYTAAVGAASELTTKSKQQSGMSFGVATSTFPVAAAAGKQVHYSGYIKTEGVTRGWAGLWWRVDGAPSQVLAFDNMQDRGATGTTDWKRYEITLPVAKEAKNINFGGLHTGDGTAWFDGLKVELDGVEYTDKSAFDLGFESPTPKGFYTGGDGYSVHVDDRVFQSGQQSLQMKFTGSGDNKAVDPKEAVASWKAVIAQLEALRKPAKDAALEWAIQNARVVLQCVQMRANEVTRDQSMADNIKWILDQNPKAKIVVWAHNGHVWTSECVGLSRRWARRCERCTATRMVTFGFAFNEGSFQAIEPGKGLRDFTVEPAPPGSLDATLAAAGIPIFALDLRNAPAWFKETHKSRSIGALYDENRPGYYADYTPAEAFDVLLFVAKTTAAHKNPGR